MSTNGGSIIPPISQLTTPPNPAYQLPGTQSTTSGSQLGPNSFLQLLTTEMMNQDPTQPQDATQSVTQLAQFSSLQYQQQMTAAFQGFQSNFGVLQASSLIGKQVTVGITDSSGNSSTTTGTINSIDVQNGTPYFTMVDANGKPIADSTGKPYLFSLTQIVGIGSGTGSTGNTTPGSTGNTDCMDPNDINRIAPPGILPGPAPRPVGTPVEIPPAGSAGSFRSVLEQTAAQTGPSSSEPLRFSAHAMQRLQSRNITLTGDDVARMNAMADKAAAKGAKQSLFILRDTAMVVSIKNRTVITAVDQDSMKENVFTNIDSAAII